jgi:molybdate transport system substrate-binding protein
MTMLQLRSPSPFLTAIGLGARLGYFGRALLLALAFGVTSGLLSACAGEGAANNPDDPLIVFAAASLTDAFATLGEAFRAQHRGQEVLFNFAGSQQLAQQIAGGAPGHVFASANLVQMEQVVASGRAAATAVQPFAANRLVVVFPQSNPGAIGSLQDLAQDDLRLVLAAEEVPVGRYTLQFLEHASASELGADYGTRVLGNVVSYELNVRAVLTKVALGEADAGIVYESDLVGRPDAALGRLEIPDALNVEARYFIAPIEGNDAAASGGAFIDFVLSAEGQDILRQFGLGPATAPDGV